MNHTMVTHIYDTTKPRKVGSDDASRLHATTASAFLEAMVSDGLCPLSCQIDWNENSVVIQYLANGRVAWLNTGDRLPDP